VIAGAFASFGTGAGGALTDKLMVPIPDRLMIFPLGEVVLFPGTLLPLHIFEQRYRKMIADSMAGDRTIGMVLVRADSSGDAPEDAPEVYPVGCAGQIVKRESLPDGRSLVVLEGSVKFRIRRELDSGEPYRIVQPQALHEAPVPIDQMRNWRDELRRRVDEYANNFEIDEKSVEGLFAGIELERIVNYLSATLPFEAVERQSLLECAGPEQRHHRLCELVDFKIAEAKLGLDSSRDLDA
jgi:Lon protease-like protein